MSVSIPSSFTFGVGLDLDADLDGRFDLDVSIPTDYSVSIRQLPTIDINLRPIEIKPLDLSLRLKEIPAIRAHFPVDYKLGFALFGAEVACLRLCGQAQTITEPYLPYPCEPQPVARLTPDAVAKRPGPGDLLKERG